MEHWWEYSLESASILCGVISDHCDTLNLKGPLQLEVLNDWWLSGGTIVVALFWENVKSLGGGVCLAEVGYWASYLLLAPACFPVIPTLMFFKGGQ